MNRWQNILYWLSTLTIIIVGFGGAALVLMIHHERNPSFWYEYLFLALINTAPLQVWLAARWQQQRLLNSGLLCLVLQAINILCWGLIIGPENIFIYLWLACIFISIILLGLSWWKCWKQSRS